MIARDKTKQNKIKMCKHSVDKVIISQHSLIPEKRETELLVYSHGHVHWSHGLHVVV